MYKKRFANVTLFYNKSVSYFQLLLVVIEFYSYYLLCVFVLLHVFTVKIFDMIIMYCTSDKKVPL